MTSKTCIINKLSACNKCNSISYSTTLTHPHTHTRLTTLFPGLPRWAGTRKEKPIWIFLKQETVSGSGIRRAICKSAPHSSPITTPVPHHSDFLQPGCPSCRPTNSVKAPKATQLNYSAKLKLHKYHTRSTKPCEWLSSSELSFLIWLTSPHW